MSLGRIISSRHVFVMLGIYVALGLASVIQIQSALADGIPSSCSGSCADKRDQCKVKACTKAGGHTQLHQGACYNLQATSQKAYSAAVAQCVSKASSCMSKCK